MLNNSLDAELQKHRAGALLYSPAYSDKYTPDLYMKVRHPEHIRRSFIRAGDGSVGKTVTALKVSPRNVNDAVRVLNRQDKTSGAEKGASGYRMSEVKCHTKRAKELGIVQNIRNQRGREIWGIK